MKQGTSSSIKQSVRENVPGKYYIIDKCIGCSLCYELSPRNFSMNLDEGYDFVFKQPETQEDAVHVSESHAILSCRRH